MTVPAVLFLVIGAATVVSARLKDVAEGKRIIYQSFTSGQQNDYAARKALDGSTKYSISRAKSCFLTKTNADNWWYVDLGQSYDNIRKIVLYNRQYFCMDNTREIKVMAGVSLESLSQVKYLQGPIVCKDTIYSRGRMKARFLKIIQSGGVAFPLCHVEVIVEDGIYTYNSGRTVNIAANRYM